MTYFKSFDTLNYDFTIGSDSTPIIENITDVSRRININITDSTLNDLCDTFVVQSGMTPEKIAERLYNNPRLHWTILYINKISDVNAEWPINENSLSDFITKKYGIGHENDIHHYEKMPEGIRMDAAFILSMYGETATPFTNYDHEYSLNESKRIIRIIKPEYINTFVSTFETI